MRSFSIEIPDPANFNVSRASFFEMSVGTDLHRIHSGRFGSTEFNATDLGDARFSPIRTPGGAVIPTLYAAETFECAVGETILRSPDVEPIDPVTGARVSIAIRPHKWRASVHSALQVTQNLYLVDLTTQGQRRLGIDRNALLAGPTMTYPMTRAWAEAIHAGCADAQGLYYTSHQFGPKFAIMLFGDRVSGAVREMPPQRSVSDPVCDREIRALAQSFGFSYEDL